MEFELSNPTFKLSDPTFKYDDIMLVSKNLESLRHRSILTRVNRGQQSRHYTTSALPVAMHALRMVRGPPPRVAVSSIVVQTYPPVRFYWPDRPRGCVRRDVSH